MKRSNGSRRRVVGASVEMLEERRLLSADVTAVFNGNLPSNLPTGGQTRIVMGLVNQGDAPAVGRATVRLYASTDPTLDATDTLLASVSRNVKLKRAGHTNLALSFAGPTALPAGDYYLLAQVDAPTPGADRAAGRVIISPHTVRIVPPNADLACAFSSFPSEISLSGESAGREKAIVQVKNVGNTLAKGTASVSFYLSADATLDASDPLLAVATRSLHLKAGQSTTFTAAVAPLPPGTAVGGYFLFAVVTPGAGIREGNTANNSARSAQRIAIIDSLPPHDDHHHHDDSGGVIDDDTTTVVPVDCGGGGTVDQTTPDSAPPADTGPSTAPADDNTPPPDTAPSTAPAQDNSPPPDTTPSSVPSDPPPPSIDTSFTSTGGDF
ncbi:MAG: hypothetical protein JWN24_3742 [Phycisphaerales bacterium]|nr:hypothetical protein [Phycisphaerales bacterium]